MVTGTLRAVLWLLGALAVLWLVLALASLPAMARMMGPGGMMHGGMMQGGMVDEGMLQGGMPGMMGMMGMMAAQGLAMLGLVGVFAYLVIDSLRGRRPPPHLPHAAVAGEGRAVYREPSAADGGHPGDAGATRPSGGGRDAQ